MAFKSQEQMNEIPGRDTSEDAFTEWTAKMHHALKPILWETCSDTYIMFKIQHPNLGHIHVIRDFKLKCWHNMDSKRKEDTKRKVDAKHDANAPHSAENKKGKKEQPKKDKKEQEETKEKKRKKPDLLYLKVRG